MTNQPQPARVVERVSVRPSVREAQRRPVEYRLEPAALITLITIALYYLTTITFLLADTLSAIHQRLHRSIPRGCDDCDPEGELNKD